MTFMDAIWYLMEQGAVVKPSSVFNKYGRFYMVVDPKDSLPPMWLTTKAMCKLAEMGVDDGFGKEIDDDCGF